VGESAIAARRVELRGPAVRGFEILARQHGLTFAQLLEHLVVGIVEFHTENDAEFARRLARESGRRPRPPGKVIDLAEHRKRRAAR
jgi:hypothetical protein